MAQVGTIDKLEAQSKSGSSPIIRVPQYRPQNTTSLIIGTPKMVPLIWGNLHMFLDVDPKKKICSNMSASGGPGMKASKRGS